MKRLLFCFFLFSICLTACKKYDENPLINLRGKEHRVTGSYKINFYSVNGIDRTGLVIDSLCNAHPVFYNSIPIITFYKKGHEQEIYGRLHGNWKLSKNKKLLVIDLDGDYYRFEPFYSTSYNEWEITKLTDHHLHLKLEKDNVVYILQLQE